MGETNHIRELSPNDRFRCEHIAVKGKVIHFVVQYEAFINGRWHNVIRYDNAHGFPHFDRMYPDGSMEKTWLKDFKNDVVYTFGINDIKSNWNSYRKIYEKELENGI